MLALRLCCREEKHPSHFNYEDALNYLIKAKSLNKGNNLELIFGLVNCYISLKEIKQARLILDEAIINNPKSELLIFNYAKFEEDLFNYKKATNLYEKGLKINPKNYKALSNLGGLYQKTSSYQNAIKVYKKAIKLEPQIAHLKISLLTCKAFSCDWSEPEKSKEIINKLILWGKKYVLLSCCHLRINLIII